MRVICVTLLLLSAATAQAGMYNGNDLLKFYHEENEMVRGFGMGYMMGVIEVYRSDRKDDLTIPNAALESVTQIEAMVIKFIKDNPDMRHFDGDDLIFFALVEVWGTEDSKVYAKLYEMALRGEFAAQDSTEIDEVED